MEDFLQAQANFEQSFDRLNDAEPDEIGDILVDIGIAKAEAMMAQMDDEEAVRMVRSFVDCMLQWQPSLDESSETDDHHSKTMCLGINALAISELFQLAFVRAYEHSDKKVRAMEAIDKAFGFDE